MQRPKDGSDVIGFGSFDNSTCKRLLDLLEPGDLRLGQVVSAIFFVFFLGGGGFQKMSKEAVSRKDVPFGAPSP